MNSKRDLRSRPSSSWLLIALLLGAATGRAADPVFVNVTQTAAPGLPQVGYPTLAWADFNNDGRLDFLLQGIYWTNSPFIDDGWSTFSVSPPPLWLNTGTGFTNVAHFVPPEPPRSSRGAVAWADYDNDGLIDYLSTGEFVSELWRNTGSGFVNVTAEQVPGLPVVDGGAVAWGDYDNDGRPDFLFTGGMPRRSDLDDDYPYFAPVAQLWRNTGSKFEDVTTNLAPTLAGVFWGSASWADFDNDGRLDFLVSGATRYNPVVQFWRNTGSNFMDVTATVAPGFPATSEGSVEWGDYDNDGRMDILVTGGASQIWRNTGSLFTNVTAWVAPTLPRVYHSGAVWGDYDDDGRLDILLAGANSYYCRGCDPPSMVSGLWRNLAAPTSAPPAVLTRVPANASATSAVLNGALHPHRQAAAGWFVWGDTTNYGQTTAPQQMGNGNAETNFAHSLSGLSPGVTYYYRALASNAQGQVVRGVEQRFRLATPVVTVAPSQDPAAMNVAVNPNNLPTHGWFEWGPTPAFGQATPVQFLANGFNATLSANLPGNVGAAYYYRAVVSNGVGLAYGPPQSLVVKEPRVVCPLGFLWPDLRTHGHGVANNTIYFWVGCDWTAINTNSWITINSPTTGPAGSGVITYTVDWNPNPQRRSGNINIGGHNVLLTQEPGYPVITAHPVSRSVLVGDTASFSVTVDGGPVSYQWVRGTGSLVDGDRISGASTSNLVLTGVALGDAGFYRCAVISAGPFAYSGSALLSVSCDFNLTATNASFSSIAATGSVRLNARKCSWSVVNSESWITILSSLQGEGSNTVEYAVAANPSPLRRSTVLRIADLPFTITQDGGGATNTIPLAEALDTGATLPWKTVGTPAWFGQSFVSHDGVDAAQSGAVTNDGAVTAQSIVIGPGTLGFWWKVSSEPLKDYLKFFVNGVQQTRISGEVDWQYLTFTFPSGVYTSKWTYSKDYRLSGGQDRGWLDQVRFVPGVGCLEALSHRSATHSSLPELGIVGVTAPADCTWNTVTSSSWIIPLPDARQGSGFVRYSLQWNGAPEARTGVLWVGGQPFTISQLPGTRQRVEWIGRTPLGSAVAVHGEPGKSYILESSDDLLQWTAIHTNPAPFMLTDPAGGNATRRFYRTVESR